ncbi:MAG: archaetidylserine decarboxylase [Pseudomonadota bacterium]
MPDRPTHQLSPLETLNFLVTNRIPRRWSTLFMGWFSRIERPLVARLSIAIWRAFVDDLRLQEAEATDFPSMHACFTRRLKSGARPVDTDPAVLTSPCDAVVGAYGAIEDTTLFQAKGFPYTLEDLLGDASLVDRYRGGHFITLRLKSSMYHRFHAPADCQLAEVNYISGDTWNVNPITLRRIERLFCRNERAVLDLELPSGDHIALVPIAAILVASIHMDCLPETLDLRYDGPNRIPCDAAFSRGDEMGYFQHGSTIVMLAPRRCAPCAGVVTGEIVRAGQALLRHPDISL